MFPAVLVVKFVQQYLNTVSVAQYRQIGKLKIQFIQSCIAEFGLAPWEEFISKMIMIIDHPNDMLIKHYELVCIGITSPMKHKKWIEFFQFDHSGIEGVDWEDRGNNYPEATRGIHITPKFLQKIAIKSFNGMVFIEVFKWIDAIYSGLQLLETHVMLAIARKDREEVINVFNQMNTDTTPVNDEM